MLKSHSKIPKFTEREIYKIEMIKIPTNLLFNAKLVGFCRVIELLKIKTIHI